MGDLVTTRVCGACTVCCVMPVIDRPDIQKPPSTICRHCVGGCGVYETRPQVCHTYHCGWRQLAMLDESWRPDLSGVLIEMEPHVPPEFGDVTGLSLMLVGNPLKTVRQPSFIDFIPGQVRASQPVFLSLPGPAGKHAAKQLLNNRQMVAAVTQSREQVRLLLEKSLKSLSAHDFQACVMTHTGHEVGVQM